MRQRKAHLCDGSRAEELSQFTNVHNQRLGGVRKEQRRHVNAVRPTKKLMFQILLVDIKWEFIFEFKYGFDFRMGHI